MPIGVPLITLRRDLRAEAGISLNPAQGVAAQATMDNQINRQQMELWDGYHWPHLRYFLDVPMVAGQDVYDYPEEMPLDQIQRIYLRDPSSGRLYKPALAYGLHVEDVGPGITPGTPRRWGNKVTVTAGKTDPFGALQITPPPSSAGILAFEGQAPCNAMVADDDVCLIDSKAIVLFAAAEVLSFQKVEAAALKLTKAQNYLRNLLKNCGADKRANYNMGGSRAGRPDHFAARPYRNVTPGLDYIP